MHRRQFLGTAAASALVMAGGSANAAQLQPRNWEPLARRLGSKLITPTSPLEVCARAGGENAEALFRSLKNPYYLGDEPGLTQTLGWIDGWTSQASDRAVVAETPDDVVAAVDFARETGVPLVIKGGGHSYFGNSNAAGSLLVWTRRMKDVAFHDAFRPAGAPDTVEAVPAVSVGAGAIWRDVYFPAARAGRYVQGGGCLTVGVAGFIQGGGFGSFSKQFGTGAANLLEAEVVTADGRVRRVSDHQDPELFFALRGGGGGTFGVITRLTLRTHPMPTRVGVVQMEIAATNETAWRRLIADFLRFYAEQLFNPHWGEQARFLSGRRLGISMLAQGLGDQEIHEIWRSFLERVEADPELEFRSEPRVIGFDGRQFWNPDFLRNVPGAVLADDRPGAPAENLFWETNLGEAGQVINAYESLWLPADLLRPETLDNLTDALVEASAIWPVGLHFNKGLAGGSAAALSATARTATNPSVLDAFALLICAADSPPAWPGIPGHEPDLEVGRREAQKVAAAMAPIRAIAPRRASYLYEADYFEPDWKDSFWGGNYTRLASAKRAYDPSGLFRGHFYVSTT